VELVCATLVNLLPYTQRLDRRKYFKVRLEPTREEQLSCIPLQGRFPFLSSNLKLIVRDKPSCLFAKRKIDNFEKSLMIFGPVGKTVKMAEQGIGTPFHWQ
jgi:hypothetical protein